MELRNNGLRKCPFPFELFSPTIVIILFRQKHYLLRNSWFLLLPILELAIPTMSIKMKGIYKSLKYITQIFVVKEREIEIGYPTDVKHVAHIGWDGPSGSGPSWMSEFKTAPDFSTSLGNLDDKRDPNPLSTTIMPPRDNANSSPASSNKSSSHKSKDTQSHDHPRVPKKQKRKKTKLGSSKSSLTSSSSSSKHLRAAKPTTTTYNEMETPPVVQV